jgi:hypothetical protein
MSVIDFPSAIHRRRAVHRTRDRNGPNMHTFLFRKYDLIVESDEADLVRDVCFDIDKAEKKLKGHPTTLARRAGTGSRPGAVAHDRGHQVGRRDRCRSTLDRGQR